MISSSRVTVVAINDYLPQSGWFSIQVVSTNPIFADELPVSVSVESKYRSQFAVGVTALLKLEF